MKKNTKVIYISEIILLIYILFLSLFMNRISYNLKNSSVVVVLLLVLVILLTFFGFKKDKNYLKGSSARIVTAALMTFMIITYGLGIILGFTRGYIYNNLYEFLKDVSPILIITIEIELLRHTVIKNSFKNKKTIIFYTIISIILNIILEINIGILNTAEDKFIFLSTIIFPIIAEEALCSYMTYKIALLPSLIYKLVIKLYIYLVPIIPNLGNYIYSVVNIILPFVIYSILSKIVIRYEKEKQKLRKINRVVITIPLAACLVVLILLISGIFKFKLIAIASNSMSPTYKRGDAIIYEKINVKELKVGDILAFQKNSIVVTHRIVEIWKQDDRYYFTTKGDNNNTNDADKIEEKNVLGRVQFSFKYIGYPTVLINEFFGKE
ncbi:MAG: signal peptidase I [Bacilli bacterium]|nr:signal peptidase I [Bacilli bacterium]